MLVFRGVIVFFWPRSQTVPTPPEWMKLLTKNLWKVGFCPLHLGQFSTSMIMGGRVLDNHQPGSLLSINIFIIQGHGDIAFTWGNCLSILWVTHGRAPCKLRKCYSQWCASHLCRLAKSPREFITNFAFADSVCIWFERCLFEINHTQNTYSQ